MLSNIFTTGLAALAFVGLSVASPVANPGANIQIAERDIAAAAVAGKFTWYNTGLGACGQTHSDGELVFAMSYVNFDPSTPNGNPNNNALCGRRVRASYNGRSVDMTLVDRCPGCPENGLDLSPAAFQALADLGAGVIQGTWNWI